MYGISGTMACIFLFISFSSSSSFFYYFRLVYALDGKLFDLYCINMYDDINLPNTKCKNNPRVETLERTIGICDPLYAKQPVPPFFGLK